MKKDDSMNNSPQPSPLPTAQEQRKNSIARRVVGRPFRPGQSGNPGGRRRGTVSVKAALKRVLTKGDADAIARRLIASAKKGNTAATKLLLNHLPDDDQSDDPLAHLLNQY